ncbi:nephrosin isoform 2 precursor [Silurus asotus]|uniref:Metalloendopeptidase n=1 Tax=Silurus asotus TaxID=30991 RepID=A0AAD5FIT4_SILAS|nr:nephrosin isoform 2 precursor [Silurus asotus]
MSLFKMFFCCTFSTLITETFIMYLIQGIVLLLLSVSVQSRSIRVFGNGTSEEIGKSKGDFTIMHGDIMVYTGLQNADPCTSQGCRWPRSQDGKVNVPYVISRQYSPSEIDVIQKVLDSFKKLTCINFVPRRNEEHYINIFSDEGCYSSVGRRNGKQDLSLQRDGCIYIHTIQHELLHALGFHHEQSRSDRDNHVRILLQNVFDDDAHNFDIEPTNNLNTPYDYNSVMHYDRCAFSKNGQPTIIPIPNNNVPIGRATEMSPNDILRVKRLYCS